MKKIIRLSVAALVAGSLSACAALNDANSSANYTSDINKIDDPFWNSVDHAEQHAQLQRTPATQTMK